MPLDLLRGTALGVHCMRDRVGFLEHNLNALTSTAYSIMERQITRSTDSHTGGGEGR